jgi:hypothetical protein
VLTVRNGPRVTRERYGTLEEALGALDERADSLSAASKREEVQFFSRRIEPARQVAARLEIAGPGDWRGAGVSGGVDLRGDGTAEAFTGRMRRAIVEQRRGETAAGALRRALSEGREPRSSR